MNRLRQYIQKILERERFVEANSRTATLDARLYIQMLVSVAFFILSVANVFSKSYYMLIFTMIGCVVNGVSALIAKKIGKARLCSISSIVTCSALFGFFVIYGGNDGFSCLWVTLLPLLAMVAMDLAAGFCASVFFQIYLIVVFWTPVRDMLLYRYNDQFCLRFPLFFFVTFILGLSFTISLRKSQYNECKQLVMLKEMTASAREQARIDSLTELSNRRGAYEQFDAFYSKNGVPHCIIMGDIDHFKQVNDTYGHEYGDDVLIAIVKIIKEQLPSDYLKARWGGEEFLYAANQPLDEVYKTIESLRKTIDNHQFYAGTTPIHITLTFGIAEYADGDGIIEAINIADNRLYAGKKAQRNCTVIDG